MPDLVVAMLGGSADRAAVAWASAACLSRGSSLTLLHVWDAPLDVAVGLAPDDLPGLQYPATARARAGAVLPVLAAQRVDAVVVAVDLDGGGISRLLRRLLRNSRSAVVVVPSHQQPAGGPVVVAVPARGEGSAALSWAISSARGRDCAVVVSRYGRTRSRVGAARADLPPQVSQVDLLGAPLESVLHLADGASLLVLERSPHHGARRLLLSDLTLDLIRLGGCPVAVVPPGQQTGGGHHDR